MRLSLHQLRYSKVPAEKLSYPRRTHIFPGRDERLAAVAKFGLPVPVAATTMT